VRFLEIAKAAVISLPASRILADERDWDAPPNLIRGADLCVMDKSILPN